MLRVGRTRKEAGEEIILLCFRSFHKLINKFLQRSFFSNMLIKMGGVRCISIYDSNTYLRKCVVVKSGSETSHYGFKQSQPGVRVNVSVQADT